MRARQARPAVGCYSQMTYRYYQVPGNWICWTARIRSTIGTTHTVSVNAITERRECACWSRRPLPRRPHKRTVSTQRGFTQSWLST